MRVRNNLEGIVRLNKLYSLPSICDVGGVPNSEGRDTIKDIALLEDKVYAVLYSGNLVTVQDGREISRINLGRMAESVATDGERVYVGLRDGDLIIIQNEREALRKAIGSDIKIACVEEKTYVVAGEPGSYSEGSDAYAELSSVSLIKPKLLTLINGSFLPREIRLLGEGETNSIRALAADKERVYVGLSSGLVTVDEEGVISETYFGGGSSEHDIQAVVVDDNAVHVGLRDGILYNIKKGSEVFHSRGGRYAIADRKHPHLHLSHDIKRIDAEESPEIDMIKLDIPQSVMTRPGKTRLDSKGGKLTCLATDGENLYAGSHSGYFVVYKNKRQSPIHVRQGISCIEADAEHVYVGGSMALVVYRKVQK